MIKLIAIGKIKEKYLTLGIQDYTKRIQPYDKLEVIELLDEKAPEKLSTKEIEQIKNKEGERILQKIKDTDYVYLLDLQGQDETSEVFSQNLENLYTYGKSNIVFVIGGSLGNGKNIKQRANKLISFGKKTFPHQLFRLFVLEQIYRGFKIIKNETYHK